MINQPFSAIKNLINATSSHLKNDMFACIDGQELLSTLKATDHFSSFAAFWNTLHQDNHMADGGKYRLRRYGQFNCDANTNEYCLLPHESYYQDEYINGLNGGMERFFEPLESGFSNHPLLHNIMGLLTQVYDQANGYASDWNIRLHPYRILAKPGSEGQPTPEGLHRDGVTYIAVLMINRFNIEGGVTTITDAKEKLLLETQLTNSFDIFIGNDSATMHGVTPISKADQCLQQAYRDVLVIAFTQRNTQMKAA